MQIDVIKIVFLFLVSKPIVKYGLTPNLDKVETEYLEHTYKASDMCEEPANSTGYWDPGYTYDVVLKNLKPNTRYYYSFGTENVSISCIVRKNYLVTDA